MLGLSLKPFESCHLTLTFRGLARKMRFTPRKAFPITLEMLLGMRNLLNLNNNFDSLVWCLFLFAFFGMLRKSNLLFTTGTSNFHILRHRDVHVLQEAVALDVSSSKTNQYSDRVHTILLSKLKNSLLCPWKAYTTLLAMYHQKILSVLGKARDSQGY